MSLRIKIIILITLTGMLLMSVTYLTLSNIILRSNSEIESANLQKDVLRVRMAIGSQLNALSSKNGDWAYWDDIYKFAGKTNQTFTEDNLTDAAFDQLQINGVIILDTKGKIMYSKFYDLENKQDLSAPQSWLDTLTPQSTLIRFTDLLDYHSGLVSFPDSVYLFTSRQILTSFQKGPPGGSLIFVKQITPAMIEQLRQTTGINFDLLPIAQKNSLADYAAAASAISDKTPVNIKPQNSNLIYAYSYVNDYQNTAAGIIKLSEGRDIYLRSQQTVLYVLFSAALLGLVLIVVSLALLDRLVITRISRLSANMLEIGNSGNFDTKITFSGRDEISQLAKNFNNLLSSLATSHKDFQSAQANIEVKEADLKNQIAQSQQQNLALEGNKKAMLNLLEDARNLEQQLKAEKDQVAATLISIGEGIAVVDKKSNVISINPAAENYLDITSAQAVGKSWYELVNNLHNGELIPKEARSITQVFTSGQSVQVDLDDNQEYQIPASGKKFPVAIVVTPLKNNDEITGAVIVFRDITKDVQSKQLIEEEVKIRTHELSEKNEALVTAQNQISQGWLELQKEKTKLTASIFSLSVGFILTDTQDNIIIANPAVSKILNLVKETKNLKDIESMLGSACNLHELHEKSRQSSSIIESGNVEYGDKFLDITVSPIILTEKDNEYIGSAILISDITEAKILDRSKDEFFSIASHELRTPLTAIRGNAAMIEDIYGPQIPDKDMKEMVNDIHTASIRLISIVNDFLDVSRLETGKITFKKEPVDVISVIDQTVKELSEVAQEKKIELKFTQPEKPLPQTIADTDKVKQILTNLVGNAVKFTEVGGVMISASVENNFVKIRVADTGRGIPSSNLGLLFRKFQQASNNLFTRDTTKGTGLGLYISRLLCSGMGGEIKLESSEQGAGSTFSFTLPIA